MSELLAQLWTPEMQAAFTVVLVLLVILYVLSIVWVVRDAYLRGTAWYIWAVVALVPVLGLVAYCQMCIRDRPNSMVLIHQPLGGAQGQQTEIAIVADFMLKTRKRLNKILSENTGQSIEKIQLDTERDNYMTAEEAKEYGLVDEIIYHHGAMPGEKKSE